MKNKETKHLRFELALEEYAEFWHIGSLLNLNKKHSIFKEMMKIVRKVKENK